MMQKLLFILLAAMTLTNNLLAQKTFTLKSQDLGGEATKTEEFNGWGCTGKNQSPQLSWMNAPEGTKSFAVTMYDPDAPTGSGWWHWVIFDISADKNELVANAGNIEMNLAPVESIQSITDYGVSGYGGPCPPEDHGLHQYIFTVYALNTEKLGLNEHTNPATVGFYLWNNTLAKASIVTYYERTKF
jgi:Raf kinase inhibitor-like YbhB/YbcL family protein